MGIAGLWQVPRPPRILMKLLIAPVLAQDKIYLKKCPYITTSFLTGQIHHGMCSQSKAPAVKLAVTKEIVSFILGCNSL